MEKPEIKKEFFEQAAAISRGAEVLPGGIEELAFKLQCAKEKTNGWIISWHIIGGIGSCF